MVQGIRCKPHDKEEPCLECRRARQDKVLHFTGITRLDIPVPRILKAARQAKLTDAVVIGFDRDGEFYFASSKADGGAVLWLMELAKKKLLEAQDD